MKITSFLKWRLIVPVFAVLLIWLVVLKPHYGGYPYYRYHLHTIEFAVEGKIFKLERDTVCKRQGYLQAALAAMFGGATHKSVNSTFGYRFPNGEGLLIQPYSTSCRYGTKKFSEKGQQPAHYPLIYWLDNAEKPSRIEVIFDTSYYKSPRPEFRIKTYQVRDNGISILPRYTLPQLQPSVQIPWLKTGVPTVFHGYHVAVYDENKLFEISELKDKTKNFTEFTIFPAGSLSRKSYDNIRSLPESRSDCRKHKDRRKDGCTNPDKILALYRRNGKWFLPESQIIRGRHVLYPVPESQQVLAKNGYKYFRPGKSTFQICGKEIHERAGYAYIYCPDSRKLMHLLPVSISSQHPLFIRPKRRK